MHKVSVNYRNLLQEWDGFGCNYVEMSHSRDGAYEDYGSFSKLPGSVKSDVLDLIFGETGLGIGLVKMFLSPYLLLEPPFSGVVLGDYRFKECLPETINFAKEGLKRTEDRRFPIRFMTTMYGPPVWGNVQKTIRGKDLDPSQRDNIATYLAGSCKSLVEVENIPVEAVSIHNEGDDPNRYPGHPGDDFNMHWTPDQVADMIPRVRRQLDVAELSEVAVAPGETTTWCRFEPYAWAIGNCEEAREDIGLITSHGFAGDYSRRGIDFLKISRNRPDLRVWTTSSSWQKTGGIDFCRDFVNLISQVALNALIPWAIIQTAGGWPGGDPNPNPPFLVETDCEVKVNKSYHFYKQLSRAGRPGMRVAEVQGEFFGVNVLGFASNGTEFPNALVMVNEKTSTEKMELEFKGSTGVIKLYRTNNFDESYTYIDDYVLDCNNKILYDAPPLSVSTLFDST